LNLKKTPYLVLFVILIAGGMSGAYALTITLGADLIEILGMLDMNNNKITNVANPTAPADAATKGYVDSSPGTDTLALLGCNADQVPRWDGNIWVCSNVSSLSYGSFALTTGEEKQDTSIAIGTDGFPVISHSFNFAGELKLIHCTDVSCITADDPVSLDSTHDLAARAPSIAIGTDGFPVIGYEDNDLQNLKVVHCTNVSCSTHDTPIIVDSEGNVGRDPSIAIGTDGFPVISYENFTGNGLMLAHCTNVSCSTHDSSTLTSGGKDSSIAIGTDGFPVISYNDGSNNLGLIHCLTVSCGVESDIFINDTPVLLDASSIGVISIAIGTDGFPIISYRTSTTLKVVHCTNVSCSTNDSPITLDSQGSVGAFNSIAIGTDGFAVISYYDATKGDLKVVHCTNVSCSTNDPPIAVDSRGFVGRHTSIASGSDGYYVVSYTDEDEDDNLKVSVCPLQEDCIGSKVIFE